MLRTVKNRFGSTSESGLFVMGRKGLKGIDDPSKYLLKEYKKLLYLEVQLLPVWKAYVQS